MTQTQAKRVTKARERVEEERRWIREHGRNLMGYVERYGEDDDPDKYGDGGRAIYAADLGALNKAKAEYLALTGRRA